MRGNQGFRNPAHKANFGPLRVGAGAPAWHSKCGGRKPSGGEALLPPLLRYANDRDEEAVLRCSARGGRGGEADLPALVQAEVENLLVTQMPHRVIFAISRRYREVYRRNSAQNGVLERWCKVGQVS